MAGMAGGAHLWRNWASNQRAHPHATATSQSTEDVAAAVRDAGDEDLTVRTIGTGHSFTAVAVTEGLPLRPDALRAVRAVDPDAP